MRTTLTAACAALALPLALSGCAAPAGTVDGNGGQLILAAGDDLGEFNPVAGYSSTGVSPLYEGLLRPDAEDDRQLPDLVPALAAEAPQVSDDGRTWTVQLRDDVQFHDGTDLDSADVAATYAAVIDPESASSIADDYLLIDRIETPDQHTVRFHLHAPNYEFSSRLLLGIAPSELITGGAATDSALNTEPVGTGPYQLDSLTPAEAVLSANPNYRDGPPELGRLVIRSVPDENARAQQLLAGDTDGTALPPRLAASLDGRDGIEVVAVSSADWRGVSLPMGNPFTADPAVRLALNTAVDRQSLVDEVLAGHGDVATTPITDAYPEHVPVEFGPHDPTAASAESARLLSEAGWESGQDGIRARGAQRAELTIAYPVNDSLRRELASAFADQMRPLGVDITLWGASWDDIEARADQVGILLGGGDNPYTVDTQARRALHSPTATSGPLDNPGGWRSQEVDDALDALADPVNTVPAAELYARVQQAYEQDPGYVVFATLRHTYAVRDTGHIGPSPILEPHAHGVTWGPWWSLGDWTQAP